MRILRVITRLNIGGPSIQAITLTTRLAARGHDTALVHGKLGRGEGDMRYLVAPGDALTYVGALKRPIAVFADWLALIRIYAQIRKFKPIIVHTHMAKAGLIGRLSATLYNLTRGKAPRARIVHTYHGHVLEGYFNPLLTRIFISLEQTFARLSDTIVAISPAIRDELVSHYRIGKSAQYRVIPLGFDLEAFAAIDPDACASARRELGIPADAEVVTTVGRLTAIKQHRLFLEVFKRVAADRPNAVAVIAGDGELRSTLENQAATLGIADRVKFLGWRRDLTTIYGASDVFLLTSRNEGTPVALIEAMAAAVPGVSTDVGGVKDVVGADAGLLAPFDDIDGLADAVTRLLADPAIRHAIGARARKRVVARYGLDRLVDDVERLYKDLEARSEK
jgi:glycosyltransferase involved in cell wall biosynthesis